MRFSEETKRHHKKLSQTAADFLSFAEDHPESLARESFETLIRANERHDYPIQWWPSFINVSLATEMERKTLGLDKLLKSIAERIFKNDHVKMADFYGLSKNIARKVMTGKTGMATAITRGDGILTADGMKFLELNCGSYVGGWNMSFLGEVIPKIPVVAEFIKKQGKKISYRNTTRMLFSYIIEEVVRQPSFRGGEISVAVSVPSSENMYIRNQEAFQEAFSQAVADRDPSLVGHCVFCTTAELKARDRQLYVRDRRVDALLEQHGHMMPTVAFRCFKESDLVLLSGPVGTFLSDKRNMALMSDPDNDPCFSEEERALIRSAVPWTRLVASKSTRYRDQEIFLPDFLINQRERCVLKHAQSYGGEEVVVGRSNSESVWAQKVKHALADSRWIVQEFIEPEPFIYHNGKDGCEPHHVVWGLFAFGNRFGGGWLRMMPVTVDDVVNSKKGATESIFLELEE